MLTQRGSFGLELDPKYVDAGLVPTGSQDQTHHIISRRDQAGLPQDDFDLKAHLEGELG